MDNLLICQECYYPTPRSGPHQYFCSPCAAKRRRASDLTRQTAGYAGKRDKMRAAGRELSAGASRSMLGRFQPVDLRWEARFSVPFSWAGSKNYMINAWAKGDNAPIGRRLFQESICARIDPLVKRMVVPDKVWISIFVQKPNHTGDAINFVDVICDTIKSHIGICRDCQSAARVAKV